MKQSNNFKGIPLVFIHGHPFNRSMWRDQLRAFSPHYHVITPDLRGYGESTVVPGKASLEDFARDIAHLLEQLSVANIVLCGLSMGGQIVLEFYRLFPQRVRALILADTFAQLDTEEGRQARYNMAERLMNEGMHGYASEVLPKMIAPRTIDESMPSCSALVGRPHSIAGSSWSDRVSYTDTECACWALRSQPLRRLKTANSSSINLMRSV